MDSECSHETIVNNECEDCGLIFEDDIMNNDVLQYDDGFVPAAAKKEQFNYYDRVSSIDLPAEIRLDVCDQISRLKEKSHVRVNTHIKNLFAMIYIAFSKRDLKFNPFEIGSNLEMDEKDIKAAIKIASEGIDDQGDKNPVCIISPANFLKEIADLFKDEYVFSESQLSKMEELIDLIQENNKMIYNENPKGVATVIIKLFFDHNGIKVSNFLQRTGRTPGYIKTQENRIIKTLNGVI